MYKGDVSFIVCAVNLSGTVITNEWNTTLAQSEVLEGIESGSAEISEDQQDVVAQLLQLITEATNQGIEDIKAAEQSAIAKISSLPKVENHIITFSATNEQEGQQSGSN